MAPRDTTHTETRVRASFQRLSASHSSTPSEAGLRSASVTVGRRLPTRSPITSRVSGRSIRTPSVLSVRTHAWPCSASPARWWQRSPREPAYSWWPTEIETGSNRCRTPSASGDSGRHAGVDPGAKQLDVFRRPWCVARHGALREAGVDVLCVLADLLVGGEMNAKDISSTSSGRNSGRMCCSNVISMASISESSDAVRRAARHARTRCYRRASNRSQKSTAWIRSSAGSRRSVLSIETPSPLPPQPEPEPPAPEPPEPEPTPGPAVSTANSA